MQIIRIFAEGFIAPTRRSDMFVEKCESKMPRQGLPMDRNVYPKMTKPRQGLPMDRNVNPKMTKPRQGLPMDRYMIPRITKPRQGFPMDRND